MEQSYEPATDHERSLGFSLKFCLINEQNDRLTSILHGRVDYRACW